MTAQLIKPDIAAIFCRRCGYCIRSLPAGNCPECGRSFDPAVRRSFDSSAAARHLRKWLVRAAALLVVAVLLALPVLWTRFTWRQEQAAIAALKGQGQVTTRRVGPAWLSAAFGSHGYWFDRASTVVVSADKAGTIRETGSFRFATRLQLYGQVDEGFFSSTPRSGLLGDDDLNWLEDRTDLRSLFLSNGTLSDKTLHLLGRFKNLKEIGLWNLPNISDQGMTGFAGCQHLQMLELGNVKITDAGLDLMKLADKQELLSIDLYAVPVSSRKIKEFGQLANLLVLSLRNMRFTDQSVIDNLAQMNRLTSLSLEGSRINGRCLDALKGWGKLTSLDLSETNVNDAGLAHLPPLPSLYEIKLNGTYVTQASLKKLQNYPSLRSIHVLKTNITSKGWQEWQKKLPGIYINFCE
jgi:hypothetical protein